MSTTDGGPVGRREVAYRLFAAEYDDADFEYSDSDEERAPNYVVTPTGARINRLFVVGVLTEVEAVSDDVLRARVADPTGAFVVYAGQYQPDAVGFLEGAEVPSFVALTGKARTFRPDDGDRVYTSIRPESMASVDESTRDHWTVQAAGHTLARVATMAHALEHEERGEALAAILEAAGVSPGLASGVALALDHYGTTRGYLSAVRRQALAAAEVVLGERDEMPSLDLTPDEDGPIEGDLLAAPAVHGTVTFGAAAKLPATAPPVASPESDSGEGRAPDVDDLGDFEPSDATGTGAEVSTESVEPVEGAAVAETHEVEDASGPEGELYELDDAEREAVEEEFGTEFSTGSAVGEPGEAGIEPEVEQPTPSSVEDADASGDAGLLGVDADDAVGEAMSDEGQGADPQPSDDIDLEDAVVEAMADLDDSDGVDREAVVSSVVQTYGVDQEAVEDAVEDALLDGRCYEPSDGTLKAI